MPWSNTYGLARALLAMTPLLTLLFTPTSDLFFPTVGNPQSVQCDSVAKIGLFCVGGAGDLELKRWIAISILAAVVVGWRPCVTAIPHWYVAFSVFSNSSIVDGGDQISAIVALLLIPLLLTDRRRWHWQRMEVDAAPDSMRQWLRVAVGALSIAVIQLQVSWLYLQSGIAKLSHSEWITGQAMYYWFRHPEFGSPGWSAPLSYAITNHPALLALTTWLPIALEVALGISLLLPRGFKKPLLVLGFSLHLLIGINMGLWSFALSMWGCLLILLVPVGADLSWITRWRVPDSKPGEREVSGRRRLSAA
ncbi:antimicrobial peptide system SdpB family protein [Rhodococcus sp. OK611]|uniref:sporulation-delaying protein SdpB family protein n=1 Tax=unclassified Rhodococcus (in: high G+C Gram-positive bacteria) TaxID=192944 RepID=UPI000BC68FD1|nr:MULTISPECIES: sporulation-delaying protein SdpB family protein [unclassified Rhodococcus (in: high G+C Gram-positive bacteria)]PTR38986.1 antimicrobial peptide system SdpB family protein [Rhodococcus sp. OK611]SNX92772.1 antimicrobial peptide system protein, SdpB family [Rhodococcus sp. OK270]